MIERAKPVGGRLEPDDEAFAILVRALEGLAERRPSAPRSPWAKRTTSWRFSGRNWTGAAHDGRDRPRR